MVNNINLWAQVLKQWITNIIANVKNYGKRKDVCEIVKEDNHFTYTVIEAEEN